MNARPEMGPLMLGALAVRLAMVGPLTARYLATAAGCSLITAQRALRRLGLAEVLVGTRRTVGRQGSHPIEWRGR